MQIIKEADFATVQYDDYIIYLLTINRQCESTFAKWLEVKIHFRMETFLAHSCLNSTVLKWAATKINKLTFHYKGNFIIQKRKIKFKLIKTLL